MWQAGLALEPLNWLKSWPARQESPHSKASGHPHSPSYAPGFQGWIFVVPHQGSPDSVANEWPKAMQRVLKSLTRKHPVSHAARLTHQGPGGRYKCFHRGSWCKGSPGFNLTWVQIQCHRGSPHVKDSLSIKVMPKSVKWQGVPNRVQGPE